MDLVLYMFYSKLVCEHIFDPLIRPPKCTYSCIYILSYGTGGRVGVLSSVSQSSEKLNLKYF